MKNLIFFNSWPVKILRNQKFHDRWIRNGTMNWPRKSPELTVMDDYFWGRKRSPLTSCLTGCSSQASAPYLKPFFTDLSRFFVEENELKNYDTRCVIFLHALMKSFLLLRTPELNMQDPQVSEKKSRLLFSLDDVVMYRTVDDLSWKRCSMVCSHYWSFSVRSVRSGRSASLLVIVCWGRTYSWSWVYLGGGLFMTDTEQIIVAVFTSRHTGPHAGMIYIAVTGLTYSTS